MRLTSVIHDGRPFTGVLDAGGNVRALETGPGVPSLDELVSMDERARSSVTARLAAAPELDPEALSWAPPLIRPGKIVCIGLNYVDHTAESGFEQPDYPTVFPRFASSLVGHGAPVVRPDFSDSLDFEGELAVVIGRAGRHVPRSRALEHVFGYAVFNDVSVREYQFKSPQWTVGKNFDDTGPFGPTLVSADELPAGGAGLKLETRLNGEVVQSATTEDMVFPVSELVAILSEAMTLEPGDVIVTGTPSGIGWAREPKLLMQAGDRCEVEIEGVGTLANPIVAEEVRA